jgi:hypothetical protein
LSTRILFADLGLAKGEKLPPALVNAVHEQIAAADRSLTDPNLRFVLATHGAQLLSAAGLYDESDALVKKSFHMRRRNSN